MQHRLSAHLHNWLYKQIPGQKPGISKGLTELRVRRPCSFFWQRIRSSWRSRNPGPRCPDTESSGSKARSSTNVRKPAGNGCSTWHRRSGYCAAGNAVFFQIGHQLVTVFAVNGIKGISRTAAFQNLLLAEIFAQFAVIAFGNPAALFQFLVENRQLL